mmetsp:Transcript_18865/g.60220  ORF Transcript_18865/g.60220 Transcript_18865/m.60220 type:complete len:330 (-) Transcript_18865:85-1074(-)
MAEVRVCIRYSPSGSNRTPLRMHMHRYSNEPTYDPSAAQKRGRWPLGRQSPFGRSRPGCETLAAGTANRSHDGHAHQIDLLVRQERAAGYPLSGRPGLVHDLLFARVKERLLHHGAEEAVKERARQADGCRERNQLPVLVPDKLISVYDRSNGPHDGADKGTSNGRGSKAESGDPAVCAWRNAASRGSYEHWLSASERAKLAGKGVRGTGCIVSRDAQHSRRMQRVSAAAKNSRIHFTTEGEVRKAEASRQRRACQHLRGVALAARAIAAVLRGLGDRAQSREARAAQVEREHGHPTAGHRAEGEQPDAASGRRATWRQAAAPQPAHGQ